jgi:hypothetical protein
VADDCGALDFTCKAKEWAGSAIGDAISNLADGVMEAFGHAIGALGTIWVRIGTPNLTGGATVVPAGEPPGTAGIDTVLGYATWIGFGIAVLGLIVAGVRLALSRSGQTQAAVERIGVVLIAVILISASVGIVTALLAPGRTASPTVSFLQNSLWYYTLAVAVLGVIVAGARMAWEQRADPGKQLVQGLLTLVVVAGAGLSVVGLLTSAADAFSVWILNNSLDCNLAAGDGTCFGESMLTLLSLTSGTTGGLGAVLAIILGVFAVFAALAQVVLMIVRAGALVILAGMLPIAAAASLSDPQRTMFRKTSAWLLGFILYKPAAAIVYAAAFRLTGTNLFGDDGLVTVLTGLALMVLALVALPALMRLIVPAVSAVSGGGSLAGLGLAGAAAALPTGAAAASRLSGGSSGGGSSGSGGSGGGSAGPTGSTGTAGGGSGAGSSGAAASGGAAAAGAAAVPPVAAASAAMTAASAAGRAARTAAETTTAGGPDGAQ